MYILILLTRWLIAATAHTLHAFLERLFAAHDANSDIAKVRRPAVLDAFEDAAYDASASERAFVVVFVGKYFGITTDQYVLLLLDGRYVF